jgi:peptidyl-prolyl cis-trans isomerase A (cyclophilin A)
MPADAPENRHQKHQDNNRGKAGSSLPHTFENRPLNPGEQASQTHLEPGEHLVSERYKAGAILRRHPDWSLEADRKQACKGDEQIEARGYDGEQHQRRGRTPGVGLAGKVEVGGNPLRQRVGAIQGALGDPSQKRQRTQGDGFESLAHRVPPGGTIESRQYTRTVWVSLPAWRGVPSEPHTGLALAASFTLKDDMKIRNPLLISALAAALAAASVFPGLTQQSAKPAGDLPDAPQATAAALVHPNGPTVVMDTSMGRITCQFYQRQAPRTVANFIALAEGTIDWIDPTTNQKQHNKRYYDGTIFHRVIPGFMIQGGDPSGTGRGGPGYRFNDEFDPNLNFEQPGRLAMANSGPNTDGSQFFITEVPFESGNQTYTIFGQCDEPGVLVVKTIARVPRDNQDKPLTPVVLKKVTIVHEGQPLPPSPAAATPKP